MQINVLEKLLQLVALQIFQSLYLSCGESINHNTLSHYYEAHIELFLKTLHILQKRHQSW